jgi:hypothetical protein
VGEREGNNLRFHRFKQTLDKRDRALFKTKKHLIRVIRISLLERKSDRTWR